MLFRSSVVKRVTTERGLDARDFPMVAFGGAGPLHATLVARELHIGTVIIPPAPGHFSAFGMLVADLRRDFVRTLFVPLAAIDFDALERVFRAMESEGERDVAGVAGEHGAPGASRALDMRYVGQEHPVTVDLSPAVFKRRDREAIKKHFDEVHQLRYGTCAPEERAEIVSLRATVSGVMKKPPLEKIARGGAAP